MILMGKSIRQIWVNNFSMLKNVVHLSYHDLTIRENFVFLHLIRFFINTKCKCILLKTIEEMIISNPTKNQCKVKQKLKRFYAF